MNIAILVLFCYFVTVHCWTTPTVLASGGTTTKHYMPVLATDNVGNWIAVWRYSTGIRVDLQYATYSETQGYWYYSPNKFLNSNFTGSQGGTGASGGLSIAFNGTFAIAVWETTTFDPLRTLLAYSTSTDKGNNWSPMKRVNASNVNDSKDRKSPSIDVDNQGRFLLVWMEFRYVSSGSSFRIYDTMSCVYNANTDSFGNSVIVSLFNFPGLYTAVVRWTNATESKWVVATDGNCGGGSGDYTYLFMYTSINGGQTWTRYNQQINTGTSCLQKYSGWSLETNYNDGWMSASIGQENSVSFSEVKGRYYTAWKFTPLFINDGNWNPAWNGDLDDVAPIKIAPKGASEFIYLNTYSNGTLYQRSTTFSRQAIGTYSRPEVKADRRGNEKGYIFGLTIQGKMILMMDNGGMNVNSPFIPGGTSDLLFAVENMPQPTVTIYVPTTGQVTSGQVTSSPLTTSPVTTSPVTTSPLTTSPVTSSPLTTSPVTTSPVTTSPLTTSPLTTSPVTTSPVTTSPLTSQDVTTGVITSGMGSSVTRLDPTTSELTTSRNTDSDNVASESSSSDNGNKSTVIYASAFSVLGIGILLAIFLILFAYKKRNTNKKTKSDQNIELASAARPITGVTIETKLGGGNFGDVYLGEWNGTKVALKKLKDSHSFAEFKNEAGFLNKLVHPNCVQFLGIFTDKTENSYIVTEYLPKGDLKNLLRKEYENIKQNDLLDMAHSAAKGMAFLETQGVIHRDIALRNFLVTLVDGRYSCKVSDFGLSRSTSTGIYEASSSSVVPVKWSAPEVLAGRKYTTKSDVWSFGVTLWEIYSLGADPYSWMSNKEAWDKIQQGELLTKPERCPKEIYDLYLRCCQMNPNDRPTFAEILKDLSYNSQIQESIKDSKPDPSAYITSPSTRNLRGESQGNGNEKKYTGDSQELEESHYENATTPATSSYTKGYERAPGEKGYTRIEK